MREIRFRAWDTEKKEMMYQYTADHDSRAWWMHIINGAEEGIIPMQYTGLKDKNGKDIYEGDILRDGNSSAEWERPVIYLQSESRFGCDDGSGDIWVISDEAEVVGNIHENIEHKNPVQD